MNKRQDELYTNLITLCDGSDMFYFADHVKDDITYRIFNYRIASYTEFLLPDALECRGHTFRLKPDGEPDALVSWTLEKFFNINEVTDCINTLCEGLIKNGRLSQHVYDKLKKAD